MDGAIFVLSREVEGDQGQKFTQNVTVFADSPTEARRLVAHEFEELRRHSSAQERPYALEPGWTVDKISLDQHKVLESTITT